MIPVRVWRWDRALRGSGVAGLVPAAKGPQAAWKLTPQLIGRIRELDATGGHGRYRRGDRVSKSSVRAALRPARRRGGRRPRGRGPRGRTPHGGEEPAPGAAGTAGPGAPGAERALARFGLLGEGAAPLFTPGARYPLAGLLLALPPLADRAAGLRPQVYGRLRDGFYGLEVMLILLVFLALLREPRAEGATRSADALGRVLGLDRAPEVKTIRRKLGELAAPARPRTCSWRWPATTPPPARMRWVSAISTGTPVPISARGTSRRCTWPG